MIVRLRHIVASILAFGSLYGCSRTPPPRLRLEEQSRRIAPVPVCVLHLPPRRPESAGALRKLRDPQIWGLVFPQFDAESRALPPDATSCAGHKVFDDAAFAGLAPRRGATPIVTEDGDIFFGSGGDRLKVAWLRTHKGEDGVEAGALALVRGQEQFAEAFGVAPFRAKTDKLLLGTARVGGEVLVTAEENTCVGRAARTACEARITAFLPREGKLHRAIDIVTERVAYLNTGERNATGLLEARLTATLAWKPDGVHVTELVIVRDDSARELRRAEMERLIPISDGFAGSQPAGEAGGESLWERIVRQPAPVKPPAAPRGR
jgi:hypothetical protein